MPTAQRAILAERIRHPRAFLETDPERRFIALTRESTRRRISEFGAELVRLGEELQRIARAPSPRPGAPRQLH